VSIGIGKWGGKSNKGVGVYCEEEEESLILFFSKNKNIITKISVLYTSRHFSFQNQNIIIKIKTLQP